tara:strand:+ start:719 stop:847 length:129 start_codon:yes stop_codon:yes gene_type:complete
MYLERVDIANIDCNRGFYKQLSLEKPGRTGYLRNRLARNTEC